MTKFPVSFYAGEDWEGADLIAQAYAVAVPREREQVHIANTTGGPVDYPVADVRHEFSGDEQTVKVLLFRAAPGVYETRGIRML
ncbi:MAG TPA: hypothetical protein VNJ10_05940 [Sphingomonas sp.]|nr:hypothetical protein [Sphingomonas sp.]